MDTFICTTRGTRRTCKPPCSWRGLTPPDGSQPFQKYTKCGTWEQNAPDPQVIIGPKKAVPDPTDPNARWWYGAGQQSVVLMGSNNLVSWYTDDTEGYPNSFEQRVYFSKSSDGITWSSGVPILDDTGRPFSAGSPCAVYDPSDSKYKLFYIVKNETIDSYLVVRESVDGIQWSPEVVLCDSFSFPNFASNVGVGTNEEGWLSPDGYLIAYGASQVDDFSNVDQVFSIDHLTRAAYSLYAHYFGGTFTGPVGYFDNLNATWYSDGPTYCGLLTLAHYHMHQISTNQPSVGHKDRSDVGTCVDICSTPAGYFSFNGTEFYSDGNGNFCGFPDPPSYANHRASHPNALDFGELSFPPVGLVTLQRRMLKRKAGQVRYC